MATDSYGQGIPYLDYTDKPDLYLMGKGIVDGLTPQSVMRFANAATRDATITSPAAGMVAWLTDIKALVVYDGTSWINPAEPPQVHTYNATATLPSDASAYTALNLGGKISGNWPTPMWSSSNPTRIVLPTAGTYIPDGVILWPGTLGSMDGRAEWHLNGSSTALDTARFSTARGSAGNLASVSSGVIIASAPGYAEVWANQHSGAALTLIVTAGVHRISTAIA